MARYSPADCVVSWAGSSVPDVTVIGDLDKEVIIEEVTPIGVAWETQASTTIKRMNPITLEAPYSTTAGDLAVVGDTAGLGATVAMIITIGGTKTVSFSAVVQKIVRTITRGAFDKYQVTIQPTGTVTEA